MSHMKLQTEHMKAYLVETTQGTEIVPCDVVGHIEDVAFLSDYCEGEPQDYQIKEGWFARYSADGFMDRTD